MLQLPSTLGFGQAGPFAFNLWFKQTATPANMQGNTFQYLLSAATPADFPMTNLTVFSANSVSRGLWRGLLWPVPVLGRCPHGDDLCCVTSRHLQVRASFPCRQVFCCPREALHTVRSYHLRQQLAAQAACISSGILHVLRSSGTRALAVMASQPVFLSHAGATVSARWKSPCQPPAAGSHQGQH